MNQSYVWKTLWRLFSSIPPPHLTSLWRQALVSACVKLKTTTLSHHYDMKCCCYFQFCLWIQCPPHSSSLWHSVVSKQGKCQTLQHHFHVSMHFFLCAGLQGDRWILVHEVHTDFLWICAPILKYMLKYTEVDISYTHFIDLFSLWHDFGQMLTCFCNTHSQTMSAVLIM